MTKTETAKGQRFYKLMSEVEEVLTLPARNRCMMCAESSEETVAKVAAVLRKFKISPKKVETEMRTLKPHFKFGQGWLARGKSEGYGLTTDVFLAVCYKLLK